MWANGVYTISHSRLIFFHIQMGGAKWGREVGEKPLYLQKQRESPITAKMRQFIC
jgi:hypothetical protein